MSICPKQNPSWRTSWAFTFTMCLVRLNHHCTSILSFSWGRQKRILGFKHLRPLDTNLTLHCSSKKNHSVHIMAIWGCISTSPLQSLAYTYDTTLPWVVLQATEPVACWRWPRYQEVTLEVRHHGSPSWSSNDWPSKQLGDSTHKLEVGAMVWNLSALGHEIGAVTSYSLLWYQPSRQDTTQESWSIMGKTLNVWQSKS